MDRTRLYGLLTVGIISLLSLQCSSQHTSNTVVEIRGEQFYINGKPTYAGRSWNGYSIEGLLFNSRMVQGTFDDLNPETRDLWKYPDTGVWDPDRNTREFVDAMEDWHSHGLIAVTLNLQGGSPVGYGNQKSWYNSAFMEDGSLRDDYMARLEKILNKADEIGMVVILGLYYFGQDQNLRDETAVIHGVDNALDWLFERRYRHVVIEIANETRVRGYDHEILQSHRIHELIVRVQQHQRHGYRYLASASFNGNTIPEPNVAAVADFILLHGNSVKSPERITEMVELTKQVDGYRPMPIVFNEDDHFDFDKPANNFVAAVQSNASWGYFDYRMDGEGFEDGYQSVPVDWSIGSPRKKAFFTLLKEITGGL